MTSRIKVSDLVELASSVLRSYGLEENETSIVLSHLLQSELSGRSSHGFYRLPGIIRILQKNGASASDILCENETVTSVLLNGGGRLGLVVAQKAIETGIQKAQISKISVVGAYNYVGTTGTMGYYNRQIADNNLIGLVFCNSEYAVAPWGGKQAILGTNPISIGIPTEHEPIVIDLATSAWSYGDLAIAMRENRTIPEGVVLDKDGYPSTDPHDADDGVQLPMAGYKGYALGLAIELLAGPFVRAKAGRKAVMGSDGFTAIILSPELFTSLGEFRSQTDLLVSELKNSPRAPGFAEIYVPGERSFHTYQNNQGLEFVDIPDSVLADLEALRQ